MAKDKEVNYPSNDDVLGGLKAAVARGDTLKDAMIAFLNAGYSKEEIQEAARNYLIEKNESAMAETSSQSIQSQKSNPLPQKPNLALTQKNSISQQPEKKPEPISTLQKEFQIPSSSVPSQTSSFDSAKKNLQNPVEKKEESLLNKPLPTKKIISRPVKKLSAERKSSQKVSNYESKPKKRIEPITIILILLLFFLILVLGAVFLFKSQLVEFFNKFFG